MLLPVLVTALRHVVEARPRTRNPGLYLGLLAWVVASGCRRPPTPVLTDLVEAHALAEELRVQFAKASGASDRAVMADTDEQSIVFAREAKSALQVVQDDTAALTPRLQRLQINDGLMREFIARFEQYRKVDQDILELAIENTNLKAQRLSFGPVRQVADSLRDDLLKIERSAARKDRCGVQALVAQAIQAVREIQVIQAPHIAEADEGVMTRMEAEMAKLEASAAGALETLAAGIGPETRPTLTTATASFAHFNALSRELVALSRRNSNVRSLALSLRRKPALTAACDAALAALQEALANERFTATR